MKKGKNNPNFGKTHPEQTKLKISVSLKGHKGAKGRRAPLPLALQHPATIKIEVLDLETNILTIYPSISAANTGQKRSEETKQKLSEYHKGKTISEITKAKMSEVLKGKICSEETKKKLSEALKGKIGSFFGKNHSEDSKRKIGVTRATAVRGFWYRDEWDNKFWFHSPSSKSSKL
jgi:hypothetical protein